MVLLAAAAETYATGGSWLSRPLCSGQILHRRVGLAHLGEHGLRWECHGPHKQLGVVLVANPDGVRALTRRSIQSLLASQVKTLMGRHEIRNARASKGSSVVI